MNEESLSQIKPRENMWPDKDLLRNVDIYDFASLMQNTNEFKTSYVGMGYYGIVLQS